MKLPEPKVARCVICGRAGKIEMNHIGGRHFVAWLTMPFCTEHHLKYHTMARQSGIDLRYTNDCVERSRRALTLIKIAEWMLLEKMKHDLNTKGETNR